MKTKTLLLLVVCTLMISRSAYSQVTIGSNSAPHNDALLDLKQDNPTTKGLLLPRVALTSTAAAAPLSAHVAGMTVYNTATAGDVTPGYYYNDGAKWVRLMASAALNFWGLTGNAGTTAGTNFLGTTDNKALMFKVNNIKSGYIDNKNTGGNTGIGYNALTGSSIVDGTALNNIAIGANVLSSATSQYTWSNIAIGNQALGKATDPRYNVAIGHAAQGNLTDGRNNTSVGVSTLGSVTSGGLNTAMGGSSMGNVTTGSANNAFGLSSGQGLTTGHANIFIGQLSGSNITTGGYNTVIGNYNNTVPNPTGNQQLNIGDLITGTGLSKGAYAVTNGTPQEEIKKVGIAQASNAISEVFDVNGTARVRQLPNNGAANSIYTKPDGTTSPAKDQTFTATRTVVVDANGVMGTVNGVPSTTPPAASPVLSSFKSVQFNSGLYNDGGAERQRVVAATATTLGCLTIWFEPTLTPLNQFDGILYVKLNSDNGFGGQSVNEKEVRFGGLLYRALLGPKVIDKKTTNLTLGAAPIDIDRIDFNAEEVAYIDLMLPFNAQVFRISIAGTANSATGDPNARIFIGLEVKR